MAKMVLGMFNLRDNAEEAISELESLGYNPKDISIMMQDRGEAREIGDSTGANVAEGAIGGATTGGALGAVAGLLIGIGAIAIPGIGGLLIGGPLATALGLSGAAASTLSGAATGAVAGGLLGALMGLGIPEDDARYYEEGIKSGGILVAVPTFTGREEEAAMVLTDFDATQVRTLEIHGSEEESMMPRSSSRMEYGRGDYHQRTAYAESESGDNKKGWFGESRRHSRVAKKSKR